MAQPIIIDDFRRQLRAQAAAAPYQFAGQALQNVTQGIEQVLFDAQQRKEREKEERLAVMAQMAGKYGFKKLGPDFAANWERDSGVKFPRNPDGTVNIPQSHEEEVTAHHDAFVQAHPELEGVDLGLMKPPMTTDEKYYKDQQHSIQQERNHLEEKRISMEYVLRKAQIFKDDGPSGWTIDQQTGKPNFVGFNQPSMSHKQVVDADRMFQAGRTELEAKLEKVKLRLAISKVKEDPQLSKLADNALKALYNPKAKPEEKEIARTTLKRVAALGGPDLVIPEKPKDERWFWQRWGSEWNSPTTKPEDGDPAHKLSPEEEATRAGF